jgi:MATE family multidrug resistance protein
VSAHGADLSKSLLSPRAEGGEGGGEEGGGDEGGKDELFGLDENSTALERWTVLVTQSSMIVASFLMTYGCTFICLLFAGHYPHASGGKSVVFAGVSLANMFANMSELSLLIGMATAVETLASQHNGAGNYKEVGIVLQRSYLILTAMTIPIAFLWLRVDQIFLALGVEPEVCEVIRRFIRIRMLCIPGDIFFESYEKYSMAIGVVKPTFYCGVLANVLILSLNSLFVHVFHWSYECLAWSWVITLYVSGFFQIYWSYPYPEVARTLQVTKL